MRFEAWSAQTARPHARASSGRGGPRPDAQEHLRREERVAAGRVAVVRDDVEHLAERVERVLADGRPPGEGAIALEVQRQVHRVEAAIHRRDGPAALVTGVERRDVVADVVPDDHAVAQVVEKARQRLFLVNPRRGLRRA